MKKIISNEIKAAIIQARKDGMTYDAIAEKFACSMSTVNRVCLDAGLRTQTHTVRKTAGRKCPKCHRGTFPHEYRFCPFCMADMRSERELVIESLQRAKDKLHTPYDDAASSISFAIVKAIAYLEANK